MIGQSTLGIGLTMFLRDQFSSPAGRIRSANRAMQEDLRKTQEDQLRFERNIGTGVALVGAGMLRGMGRMIKESSRFGYEMAFVKNITSATRQEADALGKQAMQLGQDTMFFAEDVAEGMRFMAMAGMSSQEVAANIKGAVHMAGATFSPLAGKGGAADIMTNVMTSFKIGWENSMQVADILTYATNRANINLLDLGESLKYAGSTSMDLGISLQESVAMVMALGNAGLQGSMAGVAMENAMRYLARSFSDFGSGTSKKALAEIGMSIEDVVDQKGNLLSMTEIMGKMGKAIQNNFGEGMGLEKQNILQAIFGVRGKRAASLFLRNLEDFEKFAQDVANKSPGISNRTMAAVMDTLHGQIDRTASAWGAMWIKFTTAVEPTVKYVLNVLERVFLGIQKVLEVPYLGSMLATGIMGFLVIATVAGGYKAVLSTIRLAHLSNQALFSTTVSSTVAGYGQMTAAATAYNTAQSMAHLRTLAMAGSIPGVMVNSAGRFVNSAGRFISPQSVAHTAATAGVLAGGAQASGRIAATGLLGRALGFMAGPWGIALSFAIPAAIGLLAQVLTENKSATEKNTDAITAENLKSSGQGLLYTSEMVPISAGPKMLALHAMGNTNINDTMLGSGFNSAIENAINNMAQFSNNGDINIFLDGDLIYKKSISAIKDEFRKVGIY